MRWQTILVIFAIFLVYTVLGGIAFHFLEGGNELQTGALAHSNMAMMLAQRPCMSSTDLAVVMGILSGAKDVGVTISPTGTVVSMTNRDMRSSIFFSLQLMASIGYAPSAPRTTVGRVFCILFALIGIPLFLVSAIGMGEVLNGLAESIRIKIYQCQMRQTAQGTFYVNQHPKRAHIYRTLGVFIIGGILFLLIPSLVFSSIEPWSFADALYFCFMTMLTIGFGDYAPASSVNSKVAVAYVEWYRLAVAVWVLVLLTWFATIITSIHVALRGVTQVAEKEILQTDDQDRVEEARRRMKQMNSDMIHGRRQGVTVHSANCPTADISWVTVH